MEPYKLRRWRHKSSTDQIPFYTCARPGRSKGNSGPVSDALVDKWIEGLPGNPPTIVVSLLGRKPNGLSEFSFYSFAGTFEDPAERKSRPLFLNWLKRRHPGRVEVIIEHPTIDFKPIDIATLTAAVATIDTQLSKGQTVVLVDSGGETRTRQVCQHGGFVEDSRT